VWYFVFILLQYFAYLDEIGKYMSANAGHGKMYLMQLYMVKFVS